MESSTSLQSPVPGGANADPVGTGGDLPAARMEADQPMSIPRSPKIDNLSFLEERFGQLDTSGESLRTELDKLEKEVSAPNDRMVAKLTTTPLHLSFRMEDGAINAGNCNKIFLSTDKQHILKPVPIFTKHSASVLPGRCLVASLTIQAQNSEFTWRVSEEVCRQFNDGRNPFLEPRFGYSQEGVVGTAFPFIMGFQDFLSVPSKFLLSLSEEQWRNLIVDLQKIGVVCLITGQNDIHAKNIGFGADGRVHVVDFDLCSPPDVSIADIHERFRSNNHPLHSMYVELPRVPSSRVTAALGKGLSFAAGIAEEIFEPAALFEARPADEALAIPNQDQDLSELGATSRADRITTLMKISTRAPISELVMKLLAGAETEEIKSGCGSVSDAEWRSLCRNFSNEGLSSFPANPKAKASRLISEAAAVCSYQKIVV
jgi:hypothetical protein